MSSKPILVEEHETVSVLRLHRPPANAFCLELAHAMRSVLDSDVVRNASALVLTGHDAFFSGGLDLESVPGYSREQQREFLEILNRVVAELYRWPTPVVAAINGHAVAGGFILALVGDYRVGPLGKARFGLTEARVGIPFPAVPMIVLQAECAPQDARHITLHARHLGPEQMLRRRLFDELQAPERVLGRALEVARDMASMPAEGYRRIKEQLRSAALAEIEAVIESGGDPMLEDWFGPETRATARDVLDSSRAH